MKLRDHFGQWCIRMTVYEPDGKRHCHVGIEGPINATIGEFLTMLAIHLHRLDSEDYAAMAKIVRKFREKAKLRVVT